MSEETWLLWDDRMLDHEPGFNHPERPQRLGAIRDALFDAPVAGATWVAAAPAQRAQVERVHPPRHVDDIEAARGRHFRFDPDTAASPGTTEAAWLAAGAAVQAVDGLFSGACRDAFALVRPPGHHAERDRAMGFCFFNNIAVAAAHALAAHDCERVLVLDWDVHHGNGTQHAFEDRRDVLFVSAHQSPFYPGTGAASEVGRGAGEGYTLNLPLPPGRTDGDYATLLSELLRPVAAAYDPDLVLVSAGFDAHRDDPLGGMELSADGFAILCGLARDVAADHAGGRLALLLEGGYDLDGLASSVRACVEVLAGSTPPDAPPATPVGERLLRAAVDAHRRYWPGL